MHAMSYQYDLHLCGFIINALFKELYPAQGNKSFSTCKVVMSTTGIPGHAVMRRTCN